MATEVFRVGHLLIRFACPRGRGHGTRDAPQRTDGASRPCFADWRTLAELLGEPDDEALGTTDVSEPVRALVLHFANDLSPVSAHVRDDRVDVIDGEHDAAVAQGVHRRGDGAPMALLELVDRPPTVGDGDKKKDKKAAEPKGKAAKKARKAATAGG